jgi:uncharacterized protein YecE (DUF72 family)
VRAYAGSYRRVRLERWAQTIAALRGAVDETFVYFNNDERAFAPRNAALLQELIGAALTDAREASQPAGVLSVP